MLKRWATLLLALISLAAPALAEVYTGTTAALSTVTVRAGDAGAVAAAQAVVGQRVEAGQALVRMRSERNFASQDGTVSLVSADVGDAVSGEVLEDIQKTLYEQARTFRDERTVEVHNMTELEAAVQNGFAKAMWCGEQKCEDEIKEKYNASSRNMPFDQEKHRFGETCVCCGKPAKKVMYFAKAY